MANGGEQVVVARDRRVDLDLARLPGVVLPQLEGLLLGLLRGVQEGGGHVLKKGGEVREDVRQRLVTGVCARAVVRQDAQLQGEQRRVGRDRPVQGWLSSGI